MRIFTRLGLVESIKDYWEAVVVGRKISRAINLPIRYIDIILVVYGQLNLDAFTSICSEKNPKCDLCSINSFCNYSRLQNEKYV